MCLRKGDVVGKLTVAEAVELGAGIAETWKVLASLLTEAQETEAWKVAGFDRPGDWLGGDLPVLPRLALQVGGVQVGGVQAKKAKAGRPRTASVSIPGKTRDATPRGRQDVTTFFKPDRR